MSQAAGRAASDPHVPGAGRSRPIPASVAMAAAGCHHASDPVGGFELGGKKDRNYRSETGFLGLSIALFGSGCHGRFSPCLVHSMQIA